MYRLLRDALFLFNGFFLMYEFGAKMGRFGMNKSIKSRFTLPFKIVGFVFKIWVRIQTFT